MDDKQKMNRNKLISYNDSINMGFGKNKWRHVTPTVVSINDQFLYWFLVLF